MLENIVHSSRILFRKPGFLSVLKTTRQAGGFQYRQKRQYACVLLLKNLSYIFPMNAILNASGQTFRLEAAPVCPEALESRGNA